jgi:hypothetical protein
MKRLVKGTRPCSPIRLLIRCPNDTWRRLKQLLVQLTRIDGSKGDCAVVWTDAAAIPGGKDSTCRGVLAFVNLLDPSNRLTNPIHIGEPHK